MARAKICGLTREADVAAAVDAGADALGFLVDVPVDSPREISPARAADLVDAVPPFVTTVLVTMPETPERAVDLVERTGVDAVQVHGDFAATDLASLVARVEARVLKTVDAANPERARRYNGIADALLVDSTDASGAGGTGRTHDWDVTADLVREVDAPVVLAGGLTAENVAEAVRTVDPFAVDVASGVESEGGVKDHTAVRQFVSRAAHPEDPHEVSQV
ncbi:phosphoribosylanthranilate isomerase [Halospeciosus flavus]|uniref:N-(5'-phosphoribosyl)anthranilate isomerase n=1 Tax=Halospeciosus flavus TaxID=3032283 RepID=A0ABD5Z943_9EURY|nr:phosphoribosylanthranilate isomerase [Halospeciosus flavus]